MHTIILLMITMVCISTSSAVPYGSYGSYEVECRDGDVKVADDGCNSCHCTGGIWGCTRKLCPDKLPECRDGDVKVADDGCNSCHCMNGHWGCTLKGCEKIPECRDGDIKVSDDGCNSCHCIGGIWGCTEMGCEKPPGPSSISCAPDSRRNCAKLASKGKCGNGKVYWKCKSSCACGIGSNPACADTKSKCSKWAAKGKCSEKKVYIKCRSSCGCDPCLSLSPPGFWLPAGIIGATKCADENAIPTGISGPRGQCCQPRNSPDPCLSLSPPGFWLPAGIIGATKCADENAIPTGISGPRGQCCQPRNSPDPCSSLSPPGFWIPAGIIDPPKCADENAIPTDISRPGGQCCQPRHSADPCLSLSPPGFWIKTGFIGAPKCADEIAIPTKISRPGGQCCQPKRGQCKKTCPSIYKPVCAGTDRAWVHITFSNMCEMRGANCEKAYIHFMYEGVCQDDNICPPINCPMDDCSPVYSDDPNNPGCKLCGCAEDINEGIPCDEKGGYIGEQCRYETFVGPCIPYKACVCHDGFLGEACEYDCSNPICPLIYKPVCAGTDTSGKHITFSNMCQLRAAKCEKRYIHFMHEGKCQDNNICPPIDCPMDDCSPVYYDDPNNPACKLCRCAEDDRPNEGYGYY